MSAYRQIHTKIWADAWFQDLLPEEKLLFIHLFSNSHASLCGMYELSLKTMGFETGLRPDAITLALHRFQEAGKVFYEAPWIWVPNLRLYNATSASPKVMKRIETELADIPECALKRLVMGEIAPSSGGRTPENTISDGKRETRQEQEHEQEQEKSIGAKGGAHPVDELFEAIAETCKVDPATTGASIGKVKKALLKAKPEYTPAEVRLYGLWWWGKDGMRKRPPTLWQLQEQIGVVRTAEAKKLIRKDPGALPESTEVWIPPYQRVAEKPA